MSASELSIGALAADMDEAEGADLFSVDLDAYEGPLHLLLELARRQKIDLMQISMLQLAEQYLTFVEAAKKRRIDLAADYLLMAAWLTYMKSRLLLPKAATEADDEPDGEEMAARTKFRLQRLDAMRRKIKELEAGPILGQIVFLRGLTEQPKIVRQTAYTATLYELTQSFGAIRYRRTAEKPHRIHKQFVLPLELARTNLRALRQQLTDWSSLDDIRQSMRSLDPDLPPRSVTASVFSAALELARDGEVDVRQARAFAPIYLRNVEGGGKESSDASS